MQLLKMFLLSTYDFLNSVYVPGFNVSVMSVFLGMFGAFISISVLKLLLGIGNTGSGLLQRGGNNSKIKVSKERKGDEF